MAEQAINFQNGQHHPQKFRVSGLNSISRQILMETPLYEVPGADWHGMGGQADQRAERRLHNARSKLNTSKFNMKFKPVTELPRRWGLRDRPRHDPRCL
jgi:hypothetical protein